MFTFRKLDLDDRSNALHIQGSMSRSNEKDIAMLVFQNYDQDTDNTYDMAAICMRDQYGTTTDGSGELLFKTNPDGSNLTERMRVEYDGWSFRFIRGGSCSFGCWIF